jgi:mRNA-degrading endonuclease YafQ of YafQ-DinJ toxin-antitoxin module
MKTLSRHKTFIKDMRTARLTDTQASKLFLYVAQLLKNEPLPPEARNIVSPWLAYYSGVIERI